MEGQTETFLIPEEYLAQRHRFMVTLAGIMVAMILLTTLLSIGSFNLNRVFSPLPFVLMLVGLPIAIVCVVSWLQSRYMLGQWRRMKLHIGPEGIVRESGTVREVVPWDDVTRVRTFQNPRGEVRAIEVWAAGHRPLMLFGFAPMAEVAEKIKTRVPPTTQVIDKRHAVNWENPVYLAAYVLAVVLVFEALRRMGGRGLSETISHTIGVALGIYFLVRGPLSRTNPNFRKWEVVLGLFILVTNVGTIILRMLR